jgi:hypothetical protein
MASLYPRLWFTADTEDIVQPTPGGLSRLAGFEVHCFWASGHNGVPHAA